MVDLRHPHACMICLRKAKLTLFTQSIFKVKKKRLLKQPRAHALLLTPKTIQQHSQIGQSRVVRRIVGTFGLDKLVYVSSILFMN